MLPEDIRYEPISNLADTLIVPKVTSGPEVKFSSFDPTNKLIYFGKWLKSTESTDSEDQREKMLSLYFILFKICFSSNLILKIHSDDEMIRAAKSS